MEKATLEHEIAAIRERFSSVVVVDDELVRVRAEQDRAVKSHEAEIAKLNAARAQLDQDIASARNKWSSEFENTVSELQSLTSRVEHLHDLAEMQEFGLYEPIFDFNTSEDYKKAVSSTRDRQKALIKEEKAAVCDAVWTVEGSAAKGREMVRRFVKLQLRAFNGECDAAIAKARFDNVKQLEDRVRRSWEAVNDLGKTNQVRVTTDYLQLKLDELHLAYELERKKEQEKEEQRAIRAQMKEEEQAQKELEKAAAQAEGDETKLARAIDAVREEMASANDQKQAALLKKIALLEKQFEEAHERKAKAISRAQLTRSGHIYIVSNIGAFGPDVFKIGMTRRLEPMDRVTELGDSSVPFKFDVHAMIYSDDAPTLEGAIHQRFASRQLNMVNGRREFFRVTLDEIEAAVKDLCGVDTEFVRLAVAEEYRESEAIRRKVEAERQAEHQQKVDAEVVRAKERLDALRETWKAEPVA